MARKDKFPLWLHPSGQWCKKYKGKNFYFGIDRDEALKRYRAEWDDILQGRAPRKTDSITIKVLCNAFLNAKRAKVDAGELGGGAWSEYFRCCEILIDEFGELREVASLRSEDFGELRTTLAKRFQPKTLCKFVVMVRGVFKWAYGAELIDAPVRFGNQFETPPKRVLRLEKAKRPARMLEAADIRKMIDAAEPQLKAMILLGINCGFGATDCSEMQRSALIRPNWINFPRPKTGIARRCPLWPETVLALSQATKERHKAKHEDDENCVFLTSRGQRWVRYTDRGDRAGMPYDGVSKVFRRLAARLDIKLEGGFYILRHVFATIADGTKDRVAVGLIMGHNDPSMQGYYREIIDDARLEAVTNHVRKWLFG